MLSDKVVTSKLRHPSDVKITLSGAPGDDAKHYQERDLKRAIQKAQSS
jgi:hypothetical protein